MSDHPGRFGLFATLPLPDVEGALRELEYALDTLHADGACVLSSYQGNYLGNPLFAPLMEELNRRKAVVYCHPLCAACASQPALKDGQNRGVEFVLDTTRPDVVLLCNGLFFFEAVCWALCRTRGIDVVTYERGMIKETLVFRRNVAAGQSTTQND